MKAAEVFQAIQEHSSKTVNDSTVHISPKVGQVVAQGDINFLCLPCLPNGIVPAPRDRQLAPGSTRGSRHCIAEKDMEKVEFYAFPDPNELEGPILKFNGIVRINHPEHGDQIWPAGIIVAVGYQRRYADELRRIQD